MKSYAGYHKDEQVLLHSSSGGVMTALADAMFQTGGLVFAAQYWVEEHSVEYTLCDSIEAFNKCRGSKYVQASAWREMRHFLQEAQKGTPILAIGTPCQISGLKRFLACKNVDDTKIVYCDLFCHGVPSPRIWKEYVSMMEKKLHVEITDVQFKDKRNGWLLPFAYVKTLGGEVSIADYDRLYYKEVISRPSCYTCHFTNLERPGDISLGDYWKVRENSPELYNRNGVASILVNSQKGERIFDQIRSNMVVSEVDVQQIMQQCLQHPVKYSDQRDVFWKQYRENGFQGAFNQFTKVTVFRRIVNKIRRTLGMQK